MTSAKPPAWKSALSWVLSGGLIMSWIYGAAVAFMLNGPGKGALALLIPPYALYVAATSNLPASPVAQTGPSPGQMIDALTSRCESQLAEQGMGKLSRRQQTEFCYCLARATVEVIAPADAAYVAEHGRNSPEFQQRMQQAQGSCLATAQYLADGPAVPQSSPVPDQ
jgi:hypothetical protein